MSFNFDLVSVATLTLVVQGQHLCAQRLHAVQCTKEVAVYGGILTVNSLCFSFEAALGLYVHVQGGI